MREEFDVQRAKMKELFLQKEGNCIICYFQNWRMKFSLQHFLILFRRCKEKIR